MKKKVAVIGVILLAVAYIIFSVVSYAGSTVMYVGLNTAHPNGDGYGIGNPKSGGLGIWNLRNYNSVFLVCLNKAITYHPYLLQHRNALCS